MSDNTLAGGFTEMALAKLKEVLARPLSAPSAASLPKEPFTFSEQEQNAIRERAYRQMAEKAMQAKGNHLGTIDPQYASPHGGFGAAQIRREGEVVVYDAGGSARPLTNGQYGRTERDDILSAPTSIASLADSVARDIRELVAEMPETQGSAAILAKLAKVRGLAGLINSHRDFRDYAAYPGQHEQVRHPQYASGLGCIGGAGQVTATQVPAADGYVRVLLAGGSGGGSGGKLISEEETRILSKKYYP